VRQILSFSRRTPQLRQVQSLQPLVDEATALLRSTLPPTVHLAVRPATGPLWARVDAAQFQQMVVTLCTNAGQALQDERGILRVTLAKVGAAQAAALGLDAGDHVRLRVFDNGYGMDEAVRLHIFEPFFTTKPLGQGTGLGLAVVNAVVDESGGAIRVASKPGRGTCISVYLPAMPPAEAEPPQPARAQPPRPVAPGGRVLYVDDDEIVSLTAAALLSRAGYAVTCVDSGPAAVAALRDAPDGFAAVVTDFNMPEMSGVAVAEAVARESPGTAVIVISGLVTDELQRAARQVGVRAVLFKEHMLEHLVAALAEVSAPG
jgi:CheY-like chemotaxis protein